MTYARSITLASTRASGSGKLCIRGTRITVGDILGYLVGGVSEAQLLKEFPHGMSTAVSVKSRIDHIEVTDDVVIAHLVDGRVISVPLAWSWRISHATPVQWADWELIGDGHGVHWPDIDET